MSIIGNIPVMHLNQYPLTSEQQMQLTSYQQKIRNASQKINSLSQINKDLHCFKVKEILIQEDIEIHQQDIENLQIDNPESSEEETMETKLFYSTDFKLQNEFLKSVQRINNFSILLTDKLNKFG